MFENKSIDLFARLIRELRRINISKINNKNAQSEFGYIKHDFLKYSYDLLINPKWYQKLYSKKLIIAKLGTLIRKIGYTKPYHVYGSDYVVKKVEAILNDL